MITVTRKRPEPVKYHELVVGNLYEFIYDDSKDGFIYLVGINTETKKKCAVIVSVFGKSEDKVGNVFDLSSDKDGHDSLFSGEVTIQNT